MFKAICVVTTCRKAWITRLKIMISKHLKHFGFRFINVDLAMVKALRFGPEPRPGERILVLHREWLELVFRGRKNGNPRETSGSDAAR